MKILQDKVALISGASRGIGKAIAEKFVQEGATVYAGMRNLDNNISAENIIPILLDVEDKNSIKEAVLKIKSEVGKIDILVNNAGITFVERLEMLSEKHLHKIFDTNVFGLINVTQMAIRLLKKSASATIINLSSVMYDQGDIGQTAYGASKGAVASLTKIWAKEFVSQGIRVNAVAPGYVATDMFKNLSKDEFENFAEKVALKRIAEPDEIANVILFLASDMSSYITGEIINVNGGLVL